MRRGHARTGCCSSSALLTIVVTVLLQVLLGARYPGHTLVTLPAVPLPSWLGGISLGGPITGEALLNAFVSGLRLAVLITCFGAANALAHPARLARILPAALYEVGVAVVVALTFVPQLAESLVRVRVRAAAARSLDHRPARAARRRGARARRSAGTRDFPCCVDGFARLRPPRAPARVDPAAVRRPAC